MRYVFDKTNRRVNVMADGRYYEVDQEEINRVKGIVDIINVELITDPMNDYSSSILRFYTADSDGVTDLKYMVMCKTFAPWKKKTENKD